MEGSSPDVPKILYRQAQRKYRSCKGSGGIGYYEMSRKEVDAINEREEKERSLRMTSRDDAADETRSNYSRTSRLTSTSRLSRATALRRDAGDMSLSAGVAKKTNVLKTSAYVSNRVAQALAERRMAQAADKEQNIRGLICRSGLGGLGTQGDVFGESKDGLSSARLRDHDMQMNRLAINDRKQEYYDDDEGKDRDDPPPRTSRRDDDDDPFAEAPPTSRRDVERDVFTKQSDPFARSPVRVNHNGKKAFKPSPGGVRYGEDREDGRSEAAFSTRSSKSVAESVMSRAMSSKGRY